jgi:tRNA-(ms[2]io[6]A)-hydroxylase
MLALERSEARHFELYLSLARRADPSQGNTESARRLAAREAELATQPDRVFRFHSGPPSLLASAS